MLRQLPFVSVEVCVCCKPEQMKELADKHVDMTA